MSENTIRTSLPPARTLDPMGAPVLRWGVMGTGWIVDRFVGSVQRHTQQQFVAIASRSQERAATAAAGFGIPCAYGSYEELAADPEVDVVYVATGHADHVPCARIAVEQGKHVLVEKPLGINMAQVQELSALAANRGVFAAEALWSFFLPRWDVVRQILDDGLLGEVHTVIADIGEHFEPGHRILRAEQAGGPMLDLGTYPISFAQWIIGEPTSTLASSLPHPAGVHGQLGAILNADRAQAVVHTTLFGDTPTGATISGSAATLVLPGPFYQPGDVLLTPAGGGTTLVSSEPHGAATGVLSAHEALFFEAAEVARCIAAGKRETPLRTLADTAATLRIMDDVRARCGIVYPGESTRRPQSWPD